MKHDRRNFLKTTGALSAGMLLTPIASIATNKLDQSNRKYSAFTPEALASEEDFWATVREQFTVSPNMLNLNNGGTCPQPLVVQDAMDRYNRISNEGPSYYMYKLLVKGREVVRKRLANLAGCSEEELAIQTNTTMAMETVIFGLPLKKGDEILTTTQDYISMKNALYQRRDREGIVVKEVTLPVPMAKPEDAISIIEQGITPNTKAILICHVINLTGQLMPVKEICDMAHKKGIEVIVDGAQTFAHLDFNIPDLNCDYYGTSLHKWLYAPFGTGLLYVKKDKIKKLWPFYPDNAFPDTNIRKYEHLGTRSFPSELAISQAVDFHEKIGPKRKEERLRHLTSYWLDQMKDVPEVELLASPDKQYLGAVASIRVKGKSLSNIIGKLQRNEQVFVKYVNHKEFKAMRVSPSVHNNERDLDIFCDALKRVIQSEK